MAKSLNTEELGSLEQIQAKAAEYQQELRSALAAIEHPDISAEVDAINKKIQDYRASLSAQLAVIEVPEFGEQVGRLSKRAAEQQEELHKALKALGYVEEAPKLKEKMEAYRREAYQNVNDFSQLALAHASDYAGRRKLELLKKLQEIDDK